MYNIYKLGAEKIIFGEGSINYLSQLTGDKVFIVTGGSALVRNGYLQKVISILRSRSLEVEVFDGIKADPRFSQVWEGSRKMMDFKPDWIIGLGGGSSMDAAKAMWTLYENDDYTRIEQLSSRDLVKKLRLKARLICIPSTSGTGSEVTRAAIVSDDDTHIKHALVDKDLRLVPDIAILDPEITVSMPQGLTAATGMDAITHALETYISNKSNPISDILSKGSFELLLDNITKVIDNPSDVEARSNMLIGSAVAGISFSNGGLGMCHSVSHAIGGKFGIAHGLANAIILPFILDYSKNKDELVNSKLDDLKKVTGGTDIVEKIKELNIKLNIPSSFIELVASISETDIEELIEISLNDGNTFNAPVVPSKEELRDILVKLFK